MIQDNEILALCVTLGVIFLILLDYRCFRQTPCFRLLFSGVWILAIAWILSILEGFFWLVAMNYIEHICYLLSTACFALWLIKSPLSNDGDKKCTLLLSLI